jgi:hypothetical protein
MPKWRPRKYNIKIVSYMVLLLIIQRQLMGYHVTQYHSILSKMTSGHGRNFKVPPPTRKIFCIIPNCPRINNKAARIMAMINTHVCSAIIITRVDVEANQIIVRRKEKRDYQPLNQMCIWMPYRQ